MPSRPEATGQAIGGLIPPDTSTEETFGRLIPRREYAADLGIGPRQAFTIEHTDPDFPEVIYRHGRAHITDTGYARYKAALLRRGCADRMTLPAGMRVGKAVA